MGVMGYVLLALLVLAVSLALFVRAQPDEFRIVRSIEIHAPTSKIFAFLPDFHEWSKWSPWEDLDPNMTRTFQGNQGSVGASYNWEGNKKVGAGRMELLEAAQGKHIKIQLDFLRPVQSNNITEMTLNENNGVTKLDWSMSGPKPLMSKIMGLFINIDQMVGKDFEKGLGRLKVLAES